MRYPRRYHSPAFVFCFLSPLVSLECLGASVSRVSLSVSLSPHIINILTFSMAFLSIPVIGQCCMMAQVSKTAKVEAVGSPTYSITSATFYGSRQVMKLAQVKGGISRFYVLIGEAICMFRPARHHLCLSLQTVYHGKKGE